MVVIFLIVGIFFVVAIFLAIKVIGSQDRAKKQAKRMLEEGHIDRAKAQRVLNVLSATQDNEGKRLYSKLADLVEKRH